MKRSRYTLAVYRPLCKREISQARIRASLGGSDRNVTKKWLEWRGRKRKRITAKKYSDRQQKDKEFEVASCARFSLERCSYFRIRTSIVRLWFVNWLFSRTRSLLVHWQFYTSYFSFVILNSRYGLSFPLIARYLRGPLRRERSTWRVDREEIHWSFGGKESTRTFEERSTEKNDEKAWEIRDKSEIGNDKRDNFSPSAHSNPKKITDNI